jgi:hypothetical protein
MIGADTSSSHPGRWFIEGTSVQYGYHEDAVINILLPKHGGHRYNGTASL